MYKDHSAGVIQEKDDIRERTEQFARRKRVEKLWKFDAFYC